MDKNPDCSAKLDGDRFANLGENQAPAEGSRMESAEECPRNEDSPASTFLCP
jgi:hypothetical protein